MHTTLKQWLLIGFTACWFAACDSKTTTSQDTTDKKDTAPKPENTTSGTDTTSSNTANTDGQYLMKGAESDMVEIKASETAKSKSANKNVKNLATMMIDEHTQMSQGTSSLAASKNVTLPAAIPADKQAMLDKAAGLSGTEFDKEYISQLIAGHNEAISMLEKAAADAKDADIKSWAASALPKVKHHLEMIKDTESKLK